MKVHEMIYYYLIITVNESKYNISNYNDMYADHKNMDSICGIISKSLQYRVVFTCPMGTVLAMLMLCDYIQVYTM